MFVYRKVYPFTWPVKVPEAVVPAFEFRAKFESMSQTERDALSKAHPTDFDQKLCERVFKGWVAGELVGEDEQPLLDTPENIAAIIDLPFVRSRIVLAWFEAMNGLTAKN